MSRIIAHVTDNWTEHCRRVFRRHNAAPCPDQLAVIEQLQTLIGTLASPRRRTGFLRWIGRTRPACRGVYLWGNVGSGKTFILDTFHQFLPGAQKMRLHFHRFMHNIHEQRHALRNKADPIGIIVDGLQARVIMLDEVVVNDIGDAMLLRETLRRLCERDFTLLMTSNCAPDQLYENGLQRPLFMPAIELLKEHLNVIPLNTGTDYRRQLLQHQGTYHTPCDDKARILMASEMLQLSSGAVAYGKEIVVNDRAIRTVQLSDNAVWFSFRALCETARTAGDYIQLSCDYPIILLSGVPRLDGRDDAARRFIHLIDVLYDHHVKLIAAADAPMDQLYRQGALKREFSRTASRLAEMGSLEYLSSIHRQHEN